RNFRKPSKPVGVGDAYRLPNRRREDKSFDLTKFHVDARGEEIYASQALISGLANSLTTFHWRQLFTAINFCPGDLIERRRHGLLPKPFSFTPVCDRTPPRARRESHGS